jgi:hypothetical protein
MSQLGTIADRILDAVHGAPGCELEDLVLSLPELTWNQVFLEVDRLSRTGQVRVTALGKGTYTIWLPDMEVRTQPPQSSLVVRKTMRITTVAVPESPIFEILDPIILQNRTLHPEPWDGRARRNNGGMMVGKW